MQWDEESSQQTDAVRCLNDSFTKSITDSIGRGASTETHRGVD